MSIFRRNTRYEPESEPTTPPIDKIYELDGRGRLVELEVSDDAGDD